MMHLSLQVVCKLQSFEGGGDGVSRLWLLWSIQIINIVKADHMVQAGSDEIRVVKSKPSPCANFICSFANLPIHSPDLLYLLFLNWTKCFLLVVQGGAVIGEIFGHNKRLRS